MITENATSALFLVDRCGYPTYLNAAAEAMFGYTLEEVRGASLHFAIHHTRPDGTLYPIEECPIHRAERDQGRRESYEETFIRKDGRLVPVAATTSPIVRDGVAVASVLEMRDLTGEREAGEQIEKFAALVETSTDFVAMSDLGGHGLYVNPAGLELLGLAADAVAQTTILDWCTPETAALFEREAIPRALQGDSYRGEWALRSFDTGDEIPVEGVIFLVRDPQTGSPLALGTVQRDIRSRRQREAERDELHARAEQAAADNALLSLLSDSLERVRTSEERAQRVVAVLTAAELSYVGVHVLEEDGTEVLATSGNFHEHDEGTMRTLPLNARGHTIGSLTIGPSRSGQVGEALAREIATRVAIALDNALLYERELQVSHTLQLGLLGDGLPSVEGVVLAPAYRPGTAALEVGGDWYDAFTLPSGSLALLVGDVVGHGLEAAVTMGHLRGAVRALAPSGSPAHVLEQLDVFVDSLPAASTATLAYVELEPSSGRFRYACAGHPPPLLLASARRSGFLWDGRSVPLGSVLGDRRGEGSGVLGQDETLVLYTDGLVERRNESLEVGLERLASAAIGHTGDVDALVDHVCGALLEGSQLDDDVCVLAVRRPSKPVPFRHELRASPSELAGLRQRLRSWLAEAGVDQEVEQSTVLAVSEAAANAIEHAYGFDGLRDVVVVARVDEDELHVSVEDEGSWREPAERSDRGRGMPIMEAVMEEVVVERQSRGTVVRMRRPAK